MESSEDYTDAILIITFCSLSIFGTLCVISYYLLNPKKRNLAFNLIFFLQISDLINCVIPMITVTQYFLNESSRYSYRNINDTWWCNLQGFLKV